MLNNDKGNRHYEGNAYWVNEEPEQADAGRIRATYYQKAGKLHLSVLYRTFEVILEPVKRL